MTATLCIIAAIWLVFVGGIVAWFWCASVRREG
jgi:hypothetical protein